MNLAHVLSAMVSAEVSTGLTLLRWLWARQGVCTKRCISSALDVRVVLMRAWGPAGILQRYITKNLFLLSLWSQVQMSRQLRERHSEHLLLLLLLS